MEIGFWGRFLIGFFVTYGVISFIENVADIIFHFKNK